MLKDRIQLCRGESLLDVGCGTGWFTRQLAAGHSGKVTGLDKDPARLGFAQSQDDRSDYVQGDATQLPFANNSFDVVVSMMALCFMPDWERATSEIVRVSRSHFALGLLNRNSLLFLEKRHDRNNGGYQGAHWHTAQEVMKVLSRLPVNHLRTSTGLFLPSGSWLARRVEILISPQCHFGSFLIVSGKVENNIKLKWMMRRKEFPGN
jgi:ubiquinone/menaquinone biosynthesis C-methylase UbiE